MLDVPPAADRRRYVRAVLHQTGYIYRVGTTLVVSARDSAIQTIQHRTVAIFWSIKTLSGVKLPAIQNTTAPAAIQACIYLPTTTAGHHSKGTTGIPLFLDFRNALLHARPAKSHRLTASNTQPSIQGRLW